MPIGIAWKAPLQTPEATPCPKPFFQFETGRTFIEWHRRGSAKLFLNRPTVSAALCRLLDSLPKLVRSTPLCQQSKPLLRIHREKQAALIGRRVWGSSQVVLLLASPPLPLPPPPPSLKRKGGRVGHRRSPRSAAPRPGSDVDRSSAHIEKPTSPLLEPSSQQRPARHPQAFGCSRLNTSHECGEKPSSHV